MRTLDVHPIIDNARFTPFHWMVMAWCGLLLIFDGYDLFIYGVVLPVIMKEWGLTPLQAGALGSYALFGMMFGALAFGSLADRIGRKKGIAICFALFSGATILNGFASSPSEFGIYRFIAGLGCGGLMPNAVALMNEYAPKRLRSTLVAIMFSGYSLGGMLSAGVGIFMLPRFGWESMFFAAAVPLLLLPVILYYLPESIGFLVRQGRTDEARKLLKRLDPDCDVKADDALQAADRKGSGASVLELFRHCRPRGVRIRRVRARGADVQPLGGRAADRDVPRPAAVTSAGLRRDGVAAESRDGVALDPQAHASDGLDVERVLDGYGGVARDVAAHLPATDLDHQLVPRA